MIDEYTLVKCIGRGAFGEVYLTKRKGSNQLFATKKVSKQKIESPTVKKYFINEISILKELNHKNIIRLETIRQTVHNYYIITDYYNGQDLSECLRKNRMILGKPFSEEVVQHLMRQIIDALKYLHSKRIMHRDLKLDNILINFESEEDKKNLNMLRGEVKIIDFGFATYLDNTGLRYSILGSPINMDPILLTKLINQNISNSYGYSEKADIWSLGTVCYELITGKPIFNAQNILDLVRLVEIGMYHIPTYLSEEAMSFLTSMLQYTSNYRLNAEELSKHPFLTKNVNEFTRINVANLRNKVDGKGIIINIKKNRETEKPNFDVQARLNYFQQQQIYKNFKININQRFTPAYNYFENTGPKYYKATTNRPINQMQLNPPLNQAQGLQNPQGVVKPLQNQQKTNQYLRQAYTYQDKTTLNGQINNNQKIALDYDYQNFPSNQINYTTNNPTSNNIYTNYNKNQINHNINYSKQELAKHSNTITGEMNWVMPKGTRMPGNISNNIPKQQNYNINKYQNKNNLQKTNIEEYDKYNHYSNTHNSKTNDNEYNKNKNAYSPSIPDYLKPSPVPFSEPFKISDINGNPIPFSGMDDDNSPPNPFLRKDEGYFNNSVSRHRERSFMNNDSKKEISSDALDGLTNFNIGKELELDPEIEIEK